MHSESDPVELATQWADHALANSRDNFKCLGGRDAMIKTFTPYADLAIQSRKDSVTDIDKGKGKRTRHVVHHIVYENLNSPVHPPTSIPDPDDNLAAGGGAQTMPDTSKGAPGSSYSVVGTGRDRIAAARPPKPSSPSIGNPVAEGYQNRLSESRATGQAAVSTGDHNPGAGRNPGLAVAHLDLAHQSNTALSGLQNIKPSQDIGLMGNVAFQAAHAMSSMLRGQEPGGSHNSGVNVAHYDASGDAGRYSGRQGVSPGPVRQPAHQHRTSATPDNGGHSLRDPVSHAVAGKSESKLETMKGTMRVIT